MMKFRRPKTTIDAPVQVPSDDSQPETDLSAMALDEFMAEARRRGFVPVPRGGWERICAQLDAQAEKVEGFTNLATHLFAKNGEALLEAAVAEQGGLRVGAGARRRRDPSARALRRLRQQRGLDPMTDILDSDFNAVYADRSAFARVVRGVALDQGLSNARARS